MAKRFEDSDVLVMDDESTECAWCNEEQGIPQGNGSHGSCERCAHRVYARWQMSKVPSYVDRFRDGREKF